MSAPYAPESEAPSLESLGHLPGLTLLEFGTDWCGHCQTAQQLVAAALAGHAEVRHIRIEDGPGRALGRAFRVRLWPSLVLLRDGVEAGRVVRPASAAELIRLIASAA